MTKTKERWQRISIGLMIALYVGAGINHFWHPGPYLNIIPPYFPDHIFLNYAAGIAEFILGILLFFPTTRKVAVIGIIILLLLFIPVHIYMIQIAGTAVLPLATWIAWFRLLPGQLLLIIWAWSIYTIKLKG